MPLLLRNKKKPDKLRREESVGKNAVELTAKEDITERKRAEEALRESEEKFRNIFESANDCMIYLDRSGRILDVNRKAVEVFGGPKKELVGKHFTRLGVFHFKDIPRLMTAFANILAGKESVASICIKNKKGQRRFLECSSYPIKTDGKIVGMIVIARDVTERKKAEEKIRQSEEKYRNLFENARDVIIVFDLKGNVTSVNKAVTEYGFKEDEIVGKNMLKFVSKKYWPKLLKELAEIARGKPVEGEIELITPKGKRIAEYRSNPIRRGKEVVGFQTILRDITKRKMAEEKLRESEERFRNLFENADDGILTFDFNGRITSVNKKIEEISGISREEIIGKHLTHFAKIGMVSLKDLPWILKAFKARIKGQQSTKVYELKIKNKKGQEKFIEFRGNIIKQKGKPLGILEIIRDVTERKKMEEKLKEYAEHLEEKVEERTKELKKSQEQLLKSEKLAAIGEVATMVGHDLRNPLQSIENAAYYLNNELTHLSASVPIPQKAMEMLQVINDSVDYADRIMKDLQDFSVMEKPALKKTDINAIVKEALSQIEAPDNVELITELGHLPEINVDQDMIKRVFLNLALNGIQAMEENGGTLKVSTKKTKDFVEVSFKDTGKGISKENMEKLFTPFFTTKAKGLGMGLAICKKFVEAHVGSIEVESKEGKGSTFTVKLPIQQENGGEKLGEG